MTLVLDRPITETPTPSAEKAPRRRWTRWRPSTDVLWLTPLLLFATAVNAWGLLNAPQRVDDEGTYMAQAYAVQKFGELAHYTYWYDHPPLGWLQIAAVTTVTGAFSWPVSAIGAGRVIMLAVNVVSGVLLWVLARRLDLSRPAAAGAVLLFSLSPLAVAFHRMVFLDNIAVAWTIGAFALAASRHHQLAAFCGSAACFAMACLTKETFVLLLPPLVWLMWQHALPATRRYTVAMAGALFVILCSGYLAFSALKSELVPGERRVSLFEGIVYQLVDRPGSGAIWRPETAASQTFDIWMGLDAVLLVAGALCAVAMLVVRRMRPIAVGFIVLAAMLLRTGYLPTPYVIAVLPFAALLIAAAGDYGLRRHLWRPFTIVAAATAVLFATPAWATDLRSLTHDDAERPMRQAQAWIIDHVDRKDRVLIDDAVWVDLVRAGFPRSRAVWFFKADTDPAVIRTARTWRDYDYLMVTSSVRATLDIANREGYTPYPRVTAAYRHSQPVASFGEGHDRVWIRRVIDGPDTAADRAAARRPATRPPAMPGEPTVPGGSTPVAPPAVAPVAPPVDDAPVDEPDEEVEESEDPEDSDEAPEEVAPVPPPSAPAPQKPSVSPAPGPTEGVEPLLRLRIGSAPGQGE